jgi:ABC-2 type transport system permease protein
MNKTLLVLRHELIKTLRRPSFLLVAFGIPLLAILIFAGVRIVKGGSTGSGDATSNTGTFELEVEGYVDQSGLISVIPQDIPADHLVAYVDEEQARQALESGEIAAYYLIPEDYVETGEIFYVYPDTAPLTSDGQAWLMRRTLLLNLLGGDAKLANRVWDPMNLGVTNLAPEPQHDRYADEDCSRPGFACESSPLVRYLPGIMVALFYASFMINSNLLFENVSSEKENRTIEILMLSISPRQMLAGKIIGLGIAGLLHTIAWVGTVFILLSIGGQTLNLPEEFTFPASILVWGLVFFLLGFAVYASLMAGAGVLASKLKEASQATFVILSPLMAGYLVGFLAPIAEASQGALPTALSLFPLTAPVVMMMRLTVGGVPAWQLLLSAGLMLVTAYVIVRAVAAMFHAQNLLSGQSFSVKRFFSALLGRA